MPKDGRALTLDVVAELKRACLDAPQDVEQRFAAILDREPVAHDERACRTSTLATFPDPVSA